MTDKRRLTATNLAAFQHFGCDLYLHNTYHGVPEATHNPHVVARLDTAQLLFKRGMDWEITLFTWLEKAGLLLRMPSAPLDSELFIEGILADDRLHFFIAGITFWPPQSELDRRFSDNDVNPIHFGLAKPDLIEIQRKDNKIFWRVIDAKASKQAKALHYIQIYFYAICLHYLLKRSPCQPSKSVAVWLPPQGEGTRCLPSLSDIKDISIATLASVLDKVIFREIPLAIGLPIERVNWHYGPSCRGCPYEGDCKIRTQEQGELGCIPNLAKDDVRILKTFAHLIKDNNLHSTSTTTTGPITDIEELSTLLKLPRVLQQTSELSPTIVEIVQQLLGYPRVGVLGTNEFTSSSAVVEAAKGRRVELIPRINYTCPFREDVAITISVIHDISSTRSSGAYFCTSVHSKTVGLLRQPVIFSEGKDFVANFAGLIRRFQDNIPHRSFQVYTWSTNEKSLLEKTLINTVSNRDDIQDTGLCIGTLLEGTALLSTDFQPLLFPEIFLQIITKEGKSKAYYVEFLSRLGISTDGDTDALRARLQFAIRRLQKENGYTKYRNAWEPPVIIPLKEVVERQLAFPIPGYWDLPSCSSMLLSSTLTCPSDDEILVNYKTPSTRKTCQEQLQHRNNIIYSVLNCLRALAVTKNGKSLLVNEAPPLSTKPTLICKEAAIRKLFFMQEMEVLSKLHELQKSRMNKYNAYPNIRYLGTVQGLINIEHAFVLLSDVFDIAPNDVFYNFLLVRLSRKDTPMEIPPEILFDDVTFAGLVVPLNGYGMSKWEEQHPRVKRAISFARICHLETNGDGYTTLRLCLSGAAELVEGETYRLTPRLVDFNTRKTLSSLLDIDISWTTSLSDFGSPHRQVPFLQLVHDVESFGNAAAFKEYTQIGSNLQKIYEVPKYLKNDQAADLTLKTSQYNAAQHIFANRLSIVWGPPGIESRLSNFWLLTNFQMRTKGRGRPTRSVCLFYVYWRLIIIIRAFDEALYS
ncbi:hypothetical protein GALMADRAFT_74428 [Galerina marginata CBS 339.88]|uniref:Uncharacterized protein n=1 Tax=Galerina marginata (strain CBS 339.88) TaxID=685588 RepID=A0A067SQ02_GALM3|nr:hypothetical protein GALMADRAFT_74428 [Galerina marginata CBS 339.88]